MMITEKIQEVSNKICGELKSQWPEPKELKQLADKCDKILDRVGTSYEHMAVLGSKMPGLLGLMHEAANNGNKIFNPKPWHHAFKKFHLLAKRLKEIYDKEDQRIELERIEWDYDDLRYDRERMDEIIEDTQKTYYTRDETLGDRHHEAELKKKEMTALQYQLFREMLKKTGNAQLHDQFLQNLNKLHERGLLPAQPIKDPKTHDIGEVKEGGMWKLKDGRTGQL